LSETFLVMMCIFRDSRL